MIGTSGVEVEGAVAKGGRTESGGVLLDGLREERRQQGRGGRDKEKESPGVKTKREEG